MPPIPDSDPALLTIRSLSFPAFLEQNQVSVRLQNSISSWINEGGFPFHTIGDYLDADKSGVARLMQTPNFGKKSARELNEVIAEAIASGTYRVPSVNPFDEGNNIPILNSSIRVLTFPELLDRCHASVRLRNGITGGISESLFPYGSVGEYIDGGKKATALLLSLPNIGKGAAQELQSFIENALGKRQELADQLEASYPRVFDDLLAAYRRTPDTEPWTFRWIERQIQQLLNTPRDAEVCLRRFNGETLEAIAHDLGVTRERVRQIEKKYVSIVTNIYTETWTTQAITFLQTQQNVPNRLPCNEAMSEYHRNLTDALRHVFLPESRRHGLLSTQERYQLAIRLECDAEVELRESKRWTLERLLFAVKAFATEIGKPERMPMQMEFRGHGRSDLNGAVKKFGGQSKVAALAGLVYQGQVVGEDGSRTYWTEERISKFLHEVAKKEGHPNVMPTQNECRKYAPNPSTIIAILTRGGAGDTWFEIANHYVLKYSRDIHRVTLKFVRAFVESLGDALHSLTPSEVYVLFEQ